MIKRSVFTGITLTVVLSLGVLKSVVAETLDSDAKLDLPLASATSIKSSTYIAQTNTSLATIEQAIYNQVNEYRKQQGLPALSLDDRISKKARIHSQNMASGAVPFSHDGFAQRVKEIATVIGYSASAENVAYSQGYTDPATQAVKGWLNSPGHRRNIEGNYNLTGVSVAKNAKGEYYFTQIFIRSR